MAAIFRFRVLLLVCAGCLALAITLAQYTPAPSFHTLTNKEGLSQSTNAFVYQDSYGFVWISSVAGLNRFDGRRVKVYKSDLGNPDSLHGAIIQSNFFEDQHGDLWFATDKAINCFNRHSGDFEHYFVQKDSIIYRDSLYHTFHLDTVANQLWVKGANHLFIFNTKTKESTFLHSTQAVRFGVQQDKESNKIFLFSCYWFLREGMDIVKYDRQGVETSRTHMFQKTGRPAPYTLTIQQCFVENDSVCWFATDKGLLYLNTRSLNDYHLYSPPGITDCSIRAIQVDKWGELLVSTSTIGAWKFSPIEKRFLNNMMSFNSRGNAADMIGIHISPDATTLWCSILGDGVRFGSVRNNKFQSPILQNELSIEGVVQIFEDWSGLIWCLTQEGKAFSFSNHRVKNLSKKHLFPPSTKLYRNEGKLIGLSVKGISNYSTDGKIEKRIINWLHKSRPTCLLRLFKDDYYVGAFNGLIYVNTQSKSHFNFYSSQKDVQNLFMDSKGRVWINPSDELIIWTVENPLSPKTLHTFHNAGIVNHIVEDSASGNILVANSNGLRIINPDTFKDTLITEKEGLPNQYIYAIVPDKRGNLWLSSNQGIIKYMPYKPIGQQFKHYTARNGLSSNEYCPGSALMSSSTGEIWFGSTKGVDVFHPDSINDNNNPPQLAIVSLKVHDRNWPWDSTATTCIEMAERIELNHNENTLRLELAAMEYTDPEMNKFRVWLSKDGGKPDTVELGTQNFITYANLRPGDYTFQFTACNSEGIWQEIPRRLEIIIHPHFSDTWWFRSLMGALALALIGFGTAFYYRYRLRLQQLALEKQQREAERKQLLLESELSLQEERNRIADEMHDELGGGLSTIRLASQRAKKVHSPEELQTILKRVSQISIGLVNNMRGIIWAMDSQNDSLLSLLAYIRQYAGTFLDDNGIAASLSLPSDFADRTLSSQYRHNVMLTVKECLNNILKHAEATTVELKASVDSQLLITIQDNGKGFEPTEHAGMGKGLRTTVKRMESVGGSIEWRRNPEGGMTVTLLAPLP